MFFYFSKIVLRNLWRNKTYSWLNYACLTFGFTCTVISVLYISGILSYDKFHDNYNRIYSVEALVTYFNGDRFPKEYLSASLPDVLTEHAHEIEKITRIAAHSAGFVIEGSTFAEEGFYADDSFFEIFTFQQLDGNIRVNAGNPRSIAISESMAMKIFGHVNCTGSVIEMADGNKLNPFKVAGVFRDVPQQSLLKFDYVIPFSKYLADNSWATDEGAAACMTWVLLKNKNDVKIANEKIRGLIEKQEDNLNQELFLFPLSEKVLYDYAGGKRVWKGMQTVVIIGAVGLVILLIACSNFINLAIALNIKRYRGSGIKKIVGSSRKIIIFQFLGETFIIILLSLLSALLLAGLLLDNINALISNSLGFHLLTPAMTGILILIVLLTGFIAGLFPAWYLASSSPINILKGNYKSWQSFRIFRQGMIVFQFTIPIALIICVMIIRSQDSFMRNYDIGVEKDKLIIVNNSEKILEHAQSLRADLLAIPGIEGVSFTNCIPTRNASVTNDVSWEGKQATDKLHFWCVNTDFDYNRVVKMDLSEGRFFDPAFPADSDCYVINDIAAGAMQMKNPLGSTVTLEGKKGTIIGVIENFHTVDLAGPFTPVIIRLDGEKPLVLVRFSHGSYSSVMDHMRPVFARYNPEVPLEARLFSDLPPFSDLSLPSMITGLAFAIALLLACMGLYGLTSFTAESRTKEIGIRKTNGATTFSVMGLLLSRYVKWLTFALMVAAPIAYYLGMMFLGRFNFHVSMPLWAFLAGPAVAFIVALVTVCSQTWNVARRNPVEALRYE